MRQELLNSYEKFILHGTEDISNSFLESLNKSLTDFHNKWNSQTGFINGLPVSVLLTGVNFPSKHISTTLEEVASKSHGQLCRINLEGIGSARSIVSRIVTEVSPNFVSSKRGGKVHNFQQTFSYLQLLMTEKEKNLPIYVMLENCENISHSALSEFIELMCAYSCKRSLSDNNLYYLPIYLIFSVQTSTNLAIVSKLSTDALFNIQLHEFSVPNPLNYLYKVMENSTQYIGYHTDINLWRYFMDTMFVTRNYSYKDLATKLKFCFLDNLLRPSIADIYYHIGSYESFISRMNNEQFATFLSSFPSLLDAKAQMHTDSPNSIKKKVISLIDAHLHIQIRAPILMKWLEIVLGDSLKEVKIKSYLDLYERWLDNSLCPSPNWNRIMTYFVSQSTKQVIVLLKSALSYLETTFKSLKEKLLEHDSVSCKEYKKCISKLIDHELSVKECDTGSSLSCLESLRKFNETYLQSLEFDIKENTSSKDKIYDFSDSISSLFQRDPDNSINMDTVEDHKLYFVLPSPRTIKMHELFYGHPFRVKEIQCRLDPSFRTILHGGLMNVPDSIKDSSKIKDVHHVYKLYTEASGSMINLFDWLIAFSQLTKPTAMTEISKNKAKKSQGDNKENDDGEEDFESLTADLDQKLLVRFFDAITYLNQMGLIKYSRKKDDHVCKSSLPLRL